MNRSHRTLQLTLHLFLILWGCGLGPLAYFEQLSAHEGVHAGSIAILGVHLGQHAKLTPELEAIVFARSTSQASLLRRLAFRAEIAQLRAIEPSPIQPYLLALTNGELLHSSLALHQMPLAVGAKLLHWQPPEQSLYLSPPDKPPSLTAV